jgi:DNA-binding GntR family transcriptional regulator
MRYILERIEETPILTERVYIAIRNAIINRNIAPGTKLTVDTLSRELNVSRTPVKEALVRLEREGLVETIPHKGAFVARLTLEDIEEIYDLREVLEGLSARKAAEVIDDDSIRKLYKILEESRTYVDGNKYKEYSDLDEEFHRIIRLQSKSRRLSRVLDNIEGQIRILMTTSVSLPGRITQSFEEHKKILSALERRDPTLAESYARAHIRAVKKVVLNSFKSKVEGSK